MWENTARGKNVVGNLNVIPFIDIDNNRLIMLLPHFGEHPHFLAAPKKFRHLSLVKVFL